MSSDSDRSQPQGHSSLDEIRAARLEKIEQMKQVGVTPYAYRWESTHHAQPLQEQYKDLPNGEELDVIVAIAGRIMARRVFGKLAFFTLQDETGTLQLYLEKARIQFVMEESDPQAFNHLKQWTDVGDFLGVKGTLKRTDKGELSVYVREYAILTKSLCPCPTNGMA